MPSDNKNSKPAHLSPAEQQASGFTRQFAWAMELPFVLVSATTVGGLVGFLLDRWLHTRPVLLLVLGALGFVGGVRDVLRRAARQ